MAVKRKRSSQLNITRFNRAQDVLDAVKALSIEIAPVDLTALCENYKIKIKSAPLAEDVSGLLKQDDSGSWIIHINQNHSRGRQRFTVAHELGHFFLHRNDDILLNGIVDNNLFFRDENKDEKETQANKFAAELLMPEQEFRNCTNKGMTDIQELADHFQVSTLAIRYRAKTLGYNGHGL